MWEVWTQSKESEKRNGRKYKSNKNICAPVSSLFRNAEIKKKHIFKILKVGIRM